MANRIRQEYGIKYPFTADNTNGSFIDLNQSLKSKIRSIIMHVIFTPKGQKIRDPEFGTDLIQNIFEPNENQTWVKIQDSISKAVSKYLPNVNLTNIEMLKNENNMSELYVKIQYSVVNGSNVETDSLITTL
ncbi:MAG: GPW/gp25 family protein [Bacilli bacterium]|nr:GPW/gp25 family protein [Bacilli bacterium]